MRNKSLILSILLCLCAISAWAEETTTVFNVSSVQLERGGASGSFTVSMEGSTTYSGFGMEIRLPEGYEFELKDNGNPKVDKIRDLWPLDDDDEYTHKLLYNLADGYLIVTSYSDKSDNYTATSGNLFKVYVKATSYAKPGESSVGIKNGFFVKDDSKKDKVADKSVPALTASASSSLDVNVNSSKQWSTCVFPFNAEIPEGLSVYACKSIAGDKVKLAAQSSILAYVPYLLYAEGGFSQTLTGDASADDYTANVNEDGYCKQELLIGAVTSQEAKAGYILQKQDGDDCSKFYKIADGDTFVIPTGKCYLSLPAGETPAKLSLEIEDDTDGITEVNANAIANANAKFIENNRVVIMHNDKKYNTNGQMIY